MVFQIAGIEIRIPEFGLLPRGFRDSFSAFSVEPKRSGAELLLRVVHAQAPEGAGVLRSGALRVSWNGDGLLFQMTEGGTGAALLLSQGTPEMIFYMPDTAAEDCARTEEARLLFRAGFETVAAKRGIASIHAAAVVEGGECVCLTGVSGAGKSTLAGNCLRAVPAAKLLNGDRPLIAMAGHSIRVFGAPWSGKETVFLAESAPLRAIVEVRQYPENHLRRLEPAAAGQLLLNRCAKPVWDSAALLGVTDMADRLARTIPAFLFYCTDSIAAGEFLNRALREKLEVPVACAQAQEYRRQEPDAGQSVCFSETGSFLWERLRSHVSAELLAESLQGAYEVSAEQARMDTERFLSALEAAGLLETSRRGFC